MPEIVRGDTDERRVTLGPNGLIRSLHYPAGELEALGVDLRKALLTEGADLYFKGPFDPEPRHYRVVAVRDQEEGWKQIDVEPIGA